jgi:hypothetical protein
MYIKSRFVPSGLRPHAEIARGGRKSRNRLRLGRCILGGAKPIRTLRGGSRASPRVPVSAFELFEVSVRASKAMAIPRRGESHRLAWDCDDGSELMAMRGPADPGRRRFTGSVTAG